MGRGIPCKCSMLMTVGLLVMGLDWFNTTDSQTGVRDMRGEGVLTLTELTVTLKATLTRVQFPSDRSGAVRRSRGGWVALICTHC